MKNYRMHDYAFNKKSDGIVYRFADGTTYVVTLDAYLAENPGKTAADFAALKAFSDADYLERDRAEYRQTWKNVYFSRAHEEELPGDALTPEEIFFGSIDSDEDKARRSKKLELANAALDTLSEFQRRRYLMHEVEGLSTRKIADLEGVLQSTVMDSIDGAKKRIKEFLKKSSV